MRHEEPLRLLARSSATANVSDVNCSATTVRSRLLACFHRLLLQRGNQSLKLLMGLLMNRTYLFTPLLRGERRIGTYGGDL